MNCSLGNVSLFELSIKGDGHSVDDRLKQIPGIGKIVAQKNTNNTTN